MSLHEHRFATKAEIRRAISAIRATGMSIGSVELLPDGSIRLHTSDAVINAAANDFDRLDADGLL
jgi:hypothetical protein